MRRVADPQAATDCVSHNAGGEVDLAAEGVFILKANFTEMEAGSEADLRVSGVGNECQEGIQPRGTVVKGGENAIAEVLDEVTCVYFDLGLAPVHMPAADLVPGVVAQFVAQVGAVHDVGKGNGEREGFGAMRPVLEVVATFP